MAWSGIPSGVPVNVPDPSFHAADFHPDYNSNSREWQVQSRREELSETEIIAGLVDLGLSYRLLSDKIFFVDFLLVEPVYIYGKVMILC